jgi:sigma-B regulation protein RsbU (phosphoserine phosphatase)
LGLRADTQYATSAPIGLAPGDVILLLTDGIEEALSPAEEFYGVERVLEVVRANQPRSAQEIVAAIFQALRAFTRNSPQLDDLTVVVAKVVPLAA